MAMLTEFYQWLVELFSEGEQLDAGVVRERMVEAGYGDVTAEDVYESVQTMVETGDVFSPDQSSMLTAYTGGGNADQGLYAPGLGSQATSIGEHHAPVYGGSSGGSSSAAAAAGSSSAAAAAHAAPPPPPPMEPAPGQSALDAAISQITYVNNVTNTTYVDDSDTYEDNDTVVDSSVAQTIYADGDVHQDFDTTIASGDGAVAAGDDIEDSQVITGDNEGVISGGDSYLEGSAVGDNNTVVSDSEGVAIGDGATSISDSNINAPVATGGGDAIQAEQIAGGDAIQADDSAVATGGGDAINDSNANTGDGDFIQADDSNVNTGSGDLVDDAYGNVNTGAGNLVDADNSVASGEGDVQGINQSNAEAVGFGDGDVSSDDTSQYIENSNIEDSALATGQDNTAYTDNVDEDTAVATNVDIDHSDVAGIGTAGIGDAEGEFEPHVEDVTIDLEEDHEYADDM